jgi:putative polyketide hydroxylase
MRGVIASVPESPAMGAVTSQDRLEPMLIGNATARLRFGTELVALEERAGRHRNVGGPLQWYISHRDGRVCAGHGRRQLHRSGADGHRYGRSWSGGADEHGRVRCGPGPLAERSPRRRALPARRPPHALYPEGGWALAATNVADPDSADWPAYVRRGLGIPDLLVEVRQIQHWTINAFIAERSWSRILTW